MEFSKNTYIAMIKTNLTNGLIMQLAALKSRDKSNKFFSKSALTF